MDDYIIKSLDKIENPLVKQTVEYLITNIHEAEDAERHDVAKSALLLYLNAAAPQILKNDIAVEQALSKSAEEMQGAGQKTVNYEKQLKKLLASNGIYYFGPISKHNTKFGRPGDPDAPGDKRYPYASKPPHGEKGGKMKLPSQTVTGMSHAQRPGKREMISALRDFQRLTGFEIGSRNELLTWSHEKLQQYMNNQFPRFMQDFMEGSGRVNESSPNKGWQNTVEADRLQMISRYLSSPSAPEFISGKPKAEVAEKVKSRLKELAGPKPSAPGAPLDGSTLPQQLSSMADVPRDNKLWSNFQQLKPQIQRKIENWLSQEPREVSLVNNLVNEAAKNKANVKPERSQGNQDLPRWMSEEAANDPDVEIDRPTQEAIAQQTGRTLPPTAEQAAADAKLEQQLDREKRKKKGIQSRGGGARSVTGGDIRNALASVEDGMPQYPENSVQSLRSLASKLRRGGIDKQKAVDIAAKLASSYDTVQSSNKGDIKLSPKETRAAKNELNTALNQIRQLGYADIASYFKDKLNIGTTIHSTLSDSGDLLKSEDEAIEKFYSRLEKYTSRTV